MAQRLWNGPVAHAFLPRRQYDLARKKHFRSGCGPHLGRKQSASRWRDLDDIATIAHRQAHDTPEPE